MRKWSCVCIFFLFLIFDLLFEMLIIRNNFTCKKMFWFCSSTLCLVFLCLYCCVAVSSSVELLWEAVMKFLCFITYLKFENKWKTLFHTSNNMLWHYWWHNDKWSWILCWCECSFVMLSTGVKSNVFMQCLCWSWAKM